MNRHWIINERAYAGDEHLDTDYVAGYEHKAGTDPREEVALLRGLGLDETCTVVDLGAGTGSLFRFLAPIIGRGQDWILADADAALLEDAFGRTAAWAAKVGAGKIELSMTHSRELAAAVAVVLEIE